MRKIYFLAVASSLLFSYCSKHVENIPQTPPLSTTKYLFANAGSDTMICMPFGGTGDIFKGILDARASHDDSGKIVSYSWTEIGNSSAGISFPAKDLTEVKILGGIHRFILEVRDDHGRVDEDKVTLNVIQKFDNEYGGLSWDSTNGGLATISVQFKPGLMESWPDFSSYYVNNSDVYLTNSFSFGECEDISSWKKLPYVPFENIQQTSNSVFYTLISSPQNNINHATLYPEIFAKLNSGIDISQKVSIGFVNRSPWDY